MHARFVKHLLFAALLIFTFSSHARINAPRLTVHGRLTFYNGTPSWRIWVVGTKRLLGVRQSGNEVPDVPKELLNLISPDRDVFADFTVEPLTRDEPGTMRFVRVVSVSKIVVAQDNKIVLKRAKL